MDSNGYQWFPLSCVGCGHQQHWCCHLYLQVLHSFTDGWQLVHLHCVQYHQDWVYSDPCCGLVTHSLLVMDGAVCWIGGAG